MKKLALTLALALSLTGCAKMAAVNSAVESADVVLARISGDEVPKACGIFNVAAGYFANVENRVSSTARLRVAQATAAVNAICANPPRNTWEGIAAIAGAWTAVQAATTVPR